MSRLIQIFEHERLTLYPNERNEFLMPNELKKLYEFNDKNENKYFTGIRDGVKFSNYVGIIQIGGLTIEILPKADKKKHPEKADFTQWRNVLLNMLAICRHIKVNAVSEAALSKRYFSLLELYFDLFLDEMSKLLRKGLIKKYRSHSSNTNALKGRILFGKHIQKNIVHQERVYSTHQVYDREHIINQILLKALAILWKVSVNIKMKDRISRLKIDFPEMKEIDITKIHFEKVKESRKTIPYNEALKIAKMIILNYSPDIRNGTEDMLTLLFDMNKLWEEYIFRVLQRANVEGYTIKFQNAQVFWENKTIRPDLVVVKTINGVSESCVIDTKWKIIDNRNPSDEDLKQMFAYNIYWDSHKSMLLYPQVVEYSETFGIFHKGREAGTACKLGFVSILDSTGKLDLEIGKTILEKIT
jgi:5-methylcytosine-specific restriction enzyme subunit McrC